MKWPNVVSVVSVAWNVKLYAFVHRDRALDPCMAFQLHAACNVSSDASARITVVLIKQSHLHFNS